MYKFLQSVVQGVPTLPGPPFLPPPVLQPLLTISRLEMLHPLHGLLPAVRVRLHQAAHSLMDPLDGGAVLGSGIPECRCVIRPRPEANAIIIRLASEIPSTKKCLKDVSYTPTRCVRKRLAAEDVCNTLFLPPFPRALFCWAGGARVRRHQVALRRRGDLGGGAHDRAAALEVLRDVARVLPRCRAELSEHPQGERAHLPREAFSGRELTLGSGRVAVRQ